jgi:nucleoside-diphosphate-sugar epimerase
MVMAKTIERAVVTGPSGYLGRHIVNQCLDRGIAVAVLVRDPKTARNINGLEPIYLSSDWQCRILDFAPDAILHSAAWSGLLHQPGDIDAVVDANIRFGTHLLETASRLARPPAFVWAGTFWQYAKGGHEYVPNSLYAATKQAFAAITEYYRHMRSLSCVGLILHDIYGEDDQRQRLLSLIAAALSERSEALDLTNGEQAISFVHVLDAARAFIETAENLHADETISANGVYSVVGNDRRPLREQIEDVLRPEDDRSRLRWGNRPHAAGAVRDLAELPELPGWKQLITLREGFESLRRNV